MPEFRLLDGIGEPTLSTVVNSLLAVMCYPTDAELRRQLFVAQDIGCLSPTDELEVKGGFLQALLKAPSSEQIFSEALAVRQRADAAGQVFLMLFIMAEHREHRIKYPSVSKAIAVAESVDLPEDMPNSERHLEDCFSEYKSVAPLWGAMRAFDMVRGADFGDFSRMTEPDIQALFRFSERLRQFGESFQARGAHGPVLATDEAWRFPDIEPMEMEVTALPDWFLAPLLEKFKRL